MIGMLNVLWRYRQFVASSVRNELIHRFARSKIGALWVIINPLAQVAIYALILSNVLAAKLPGIESAHGYAIYLMAGLLAWTLFNELVMRCLNLFVEQGNLMKKISFPRITLPAIVLGSSLINNALLFLAMLLIFLLVGHDFTFAMIWLLPLTGLLVLLGVGIGLTLGVMNVFLRDLSQFVPIAMQMWFWLTPIVYPILILSDAFKPYMQLNPLYPILTAYQDVVVYGSRPDLNGLGSIAIVSFCLLAFGLFLFRRASPEMVDAL